jgi:hypothetical protein
MPLNALGSLRRGGRRIAFLTLGIRPGNPVGNNPVSIRGYYQNVSFVTFPAVRIRAMLFVLGQGRSQK